MTKLSIYPTELAQLSVGQLAALPAGELAEAHHNLNELAAWTKQVRAKLDAALVQRYGEQAQAALHTCGRDFGTTHISDGTVQIKAEYPKRVKWDQNHLKAAATRIAAAGEDVQDYIDMRFSISESRFTNWPDVLQQQFVAARTVQAGKPSFTLSIKED